MVGRKKGVVKEMFLRGLFLEPYWSGSHLSFANTLDKYTPCDWTFLSLPGNHWKWRMLESPLIFAEKILKSRGRDYDFIFASSYMPLAELKGLVPEIAKIPSILYFHENQFEYPVIGENRSVPDLHYGFIQAVSALGSTVCVFNSAFNRDSFLQALSSLLARLPSPKPSGIVSRIAGKSRIIGVPIDVKPIPNERVEENPEDLVPVIIWPHRWEADKNPGAFFSALYELKRRNVEFRVVVCGGDPATPKAKKKFNRRRKELGEKVLHWGYVESRREYLSLVASSHIAVSTAEQEFFGAAMMEAAALGCLPLVPDRLAYRELYPAEFRYETQKDLVDKLENLCTRMEEAIKTGVSGRHIAQPYLAENLCPEYTKLFREISSGSK